MNKAKLISLLALAPMIASCGPTGPSTPVGPTGPGGNTIANPWWTTTGEIEKDGDGEIIFDDVEIKLKSIVTGDDLGQLNAIIDEFNAQYLGKITVDLSTQGQNDFDTIVTEAIKNNTNAPDLIMNHQKGYRGYVDDKYIQPFNEVTKVTGQTLTLNDYSASLSKYSDLGYKDQIFGVPADAQTSVILYNKTQLDALGLSLPTSRTELFELLDQYIQRYGKTPIAWNTHSDFFNNYTFGTAIVQNGGVFFDENNDYYVSWDKDENLEAFKNAMQSIRSFLVGGNGSVKYALTNEAGALNRFCKNEALFYVTEPWLVQGTLSSYATANGGLSIDAVKSNYVGGYSFANWFQMDESGVNGDKLFGDSHFFALSRTTEDITKKAACVEFVKWFTQHGEYDGESVGVEWAEAGHVSASTIISTDPSYTESDYVNDYACQFVPDINSFEVPGNTPYYSYTWSALQRLFITVYSNQDASGDQAAIASSAKEVNDIIDGFNLFG